MTSLWPPSTARRRTTTPAFLLPSGLRSPLLDLLDVRYIVQDAGLPPNRDDVRALDAETRAVFSTPRVIVHERDSAPRTPGSCMMCDP